LPKTSSQKKNTKILLYLTEKQSKNMASNKLFVEYIVDQLARSGEVTYKNMFGEYVLYQNGKLFALICDDQFFVKPTEGGRAFIGDVVEAPPYPGAKVSFLIEDKLDDPDWLCDLVEITVRELPEPKPKRKRKA